MADFSVSNTRFDDEEKQLFYNELVSYTANDFNFEVRIDAFTYLHSLNAFNKEALQNLLNASKHHNWRLQRLAKNLIEELSVDDNYRKILKPE